MKAGEAARALVEASGLGAIVRLALEAQSALVDRLAAAAKEHGVSNASIAKARAAKRKYDRAMSLVALLYPIIPNPALLRLIAGPSPQKAKSPRGRSPKR